MADYTIGVFAVGVNSLIKADGIHDLRFANQDALNFSREMKILFPVTTDSLLNDALDADVLPMRSTILAALKRFMDKLAVDGSGKAVFLFTGHGVQIEDDFVFCGRDYDPFIPGESGVRLADIFRLLRPFSGEKLIILDCCRSHFDSVSQEFVNENILPPFSVSASLNEVILFSSRSGQTSIETGGLESNYGGLFIHHLMTELRKKSGPYFCFGDSFQYIRQNVSEWAKEHNISQTPCSFGSDLSDFVIEYQNE